MRNRLFKMSFALMVGVIFTAAPVLAQTDVSVETYALPDGTSCFMVPMTGPAEVSSAAKEVAVTVDVSAAQVGAEIRTRANEAVESFLANLPAGTKVQLFTANEEATSLTGGFVAVNSPEVAEALKTLKGNTPLGAMNLGAVLQTVGDSFDLADDTERSIVFVGRGTSTSAVFDAPTASRSVEKLVADRISFSVCPNGAITDNFTLGVLASQTGGYVVDPRVVDGKEAGRLLAESQKATIYWPTGTLDNLADAEVFPTPVPPIRSDRETFLIGSGPKWDKQSANVSLPVLSSGGNATRLAWTLKPQPSDDKNVSLYQMVQIARENGGFSLPLAGRVFLKEYQGSLTAQNETTLDLAQQALDSGKPDQASSLAKSVERAVPQNKIAAEILGRADDAQSAFAKAEATLEDRDARREGNLMDASDSNQKLISSKVKTEVKVAIENSRKLLETNPVGAIQNIKLTITSIQQNPYLSDADRAELLSNLTANARELERQKFEKEKRDLVAMRNKARLDSISTAMNQRLENQKKVEEIIKRFNSLIHESQYTLAADVAGAATDLVDDLALPVQAANIARMTDAWEENQYLRIYRRERFLDVLMSVERSHIPSSDEPPILYPDAETWLALSKARKEKYADATIFTQTDAEKKIVKALDKIVDIKVPDEEGLPLKDWLNQMKNELGINIVVDQKALQDDAEIGSLDDCVIKESLLGVTFRTALNLALRDYNMRFCICKEYLYITTKDVIDGLEEGDDLWRQIYHLRYYPVSDLIMSPSSSMMMGGGMGGMSGGMGGMSGGMGGMGGGGMGGGMGGMGGGGMGGGGMGGGWNVPAAADKRPEATDAAPKGSLTAIPASLDEKWDNWFTANAPKKPLPTTSGTDEENDAKNKIAAEDYQKNLYDFNLKFTAEIHRLTTEKNFDEAAAAIKSAIRNDLAASWMYEALALVLIQKGAPQKEIESVILSAVEFTSDPVAILGIAGYLETIDSKKKALELYREISKVDPLRPEPYIRGLALARELDDEDAQKWVTLGIASGAWEGRLIQDVWEAGDEMAKNLLDKMVADGRETEAAAYEKELAEAQVRDVFIEVLWTGDAEIDLAVQEPVNTVCWFARPRTAGGGILRSTVNLDLNYEDQKEGQRSKCYVCPLGFNGDYNVLVSKTWGTLPQNKVVVKITTCIGTENEKSGVYPIELENDKALFTVTLEQGRRTEEVKEEVLTAAALVDQLKTKNGREVAEQVRQYQDRKVKADSKRAAENQSYVAGYEANESIGPVDPAVTEFVSPEARTTLSDPGYMPVIDFTYEGAMMMPILGVTPDRRYVLISPNPMIMGIRRMFQYNSVEGGGTSSYGGGGNNSGGNNNNSSSNRSGGNNNNSSSNRSGGNNSNSSNNNRSGGNSGGGGW